jgi:mRNA interferase RelE/StbE
VYKILLLPSAQKDLNSLKGKTFSQVRDRILSICENPRRAGCVKLTAENGYRLRSGDYRIIERIDDKDQEVFIYRIKHRKDPN